MPTPAHARALLVALLAATVLPLAAQAGNPAGPPAAQGGVLVAVLDSGLDLTHPEFDGSASRVVAWWDFGAGGALPGPRDAWDGRHGPRDTLGHGTAVASLAAGETLGAWPQARLVVARLDRGDGVFVRTDEAIRWAQAMGADVVIMSWSNREPAPGALDDVDDAVRALAEAGALPVVSAGNGALALGVRVPSEPQSPASSPYALVVGAAEAVFSNTDPDVVADGTSVCVAAVDRGAGADDPVACTGRYARRSGTSFAAPQVAGLAARAWQAALDVGAAPDAAAVRTAVLRTARDTSAPYAFEGWGVVDAATAAQAEAHLEAGTTPPPNSAANEAVASGVRFLRRSWTETAEAGTAVYVPRGGATPGELGASGAAVRDADLWALALEAGDVVEIALDPTGPARDLDLLVYAPWGAPVVRSDEDVVASGETDSGSERVAFVASRAGVYELSVEAWLAAGPAAYVLSVTVDGAPATPAFLTDATALSARVLG